VSEQGEPQFIDVWQKADEKDRQDAAALWRADGAISDEQSIQDRLPQLCVLCRASSGELLAMTTAYRHFSSQLDNQFYVLRMYVGKKARRSGVGFRLLHRVIEVLEQRYRSGEDTSAIGILFELENPTIQQARSEAIWPTTRFVFIGKNVRGDHVRVRYFEGARIA
jgi:GNAT superfamily N-acetyltransferase